VVLHADTLKMNNGSSLLLPEYADDKKTATKAKSLLSCFYLRGLMQREALVCFAHVLPFVIYNIFRKILPVFRPLTMMPSSR
jgi:hypothetical protein